MSKIILKGYIIVPTVEMNIVKKELLTHMELTKKEKGCLVFEVSKDSENLNRFNVYEEYINKESFDKHQKRVAQSKWGEVTVNVERHYEITEV